MTRILLTALPFLLAIVGPAGAQDARLEYGGSEFFRFFLHKQGLKPVADYTAADTKPAETLIVCVGDAEWVNREIGGDRLYQFLKDGGAVLIATDAAAPANRLGTWENRFGVHISGNLLTAKADECFDGLEGRPFVKPRRRPFPPLFGSPFAMFDGVTADGSTAIATDRPSEMRLTPANRFGLTVTQLAGYPVSAKQIDTNLALARPDDNFAVAMRVDGGPGRLLVVADHSVFVNGQMKFTANEETGELSYPTANIHFTNQMIAWLQGPGPPRTRCLFVDDGMVIDQFARQVQRPPGELPPIPPISPDRLANMLLSLVNAKLAHVQEEARPNAVLDRNPGPNFLRRGFLIVVTLAFLWLIWTRLRQATRGEDRSRWTPLASLGSLLPKGSTDARKRADLIDTGNVYEAARWRIRDRFDRLGGQATAAGDMPPLLMADQSRQAAGLEPQVRRLWLIGYGPRPSRSPCTCGTKLISTWSGPSG